MCVWRRRGRYWSEGCATPAHYFWIPIERIVQGDCDTVYCVLCMCVRFESLRVSLLHFTVHVVCGKKSQICKSVGPVGNVFTYTCQQ